MSDFMTVPSDDANTGFGEKLSELVDYEDEMSEWEYDFIGSMVDKFEKGENFTDNQVEKVNQLYDKYCD